jgi:DNA-binding NtrC family response regulator
MTWIPDGLLDLALAAAATEAPLLIVGEDGVGKKTLARRIHGLSSRAHAPFGVINCAEYTDPLMMTTIFGGGTDPGALHAARGGSLLLKYAGELSLPIQEQLIRTRGGALSEVRLMADMSRDVDDAVAGGRLLPEFVALVAGSVIKIPPLRDRRSEILPLARAFASEVATAESRPVPEISSEAAAVLESQSWPGNVRQLWLVILRAMVLSPSGPIERAHLLR